MSKFTLLVTAHAFRASGAAAEAPVRAAGGTVLYPERMGPLPAAELVPWLRQADAVVAASDPYTAEVLPACPRLRVIARWGTGYDAVDVDACTARGVAACNAPGLNVQAVADYTLGAILALARRLPRQLDVMREGGWEEVRGVELWRKSVGLVGFGAIGKAVARRLQGFDCRVLAYDPLLSPEAIRSHGAEPAPLPRLFAESDFVSLHAALTPENRGLVSETLLRAMPRHACLINAARGPLVDEDALLRALAEGRIAGAALDAFVTEPLPADHAFRRLPNVLSTPHSAFNTEEAAAATNARVVEQVLAVLRGERPAGLLNSAAFDHPAARARAPLLQR